MELRLETAEGEELLKELNTTRENDFNKGRMMILEIINKAINNGGDSYWEAFKGDLTSILYEMQENGLLPKPINNSWIPDVSNASDYVKSRWTDKPLEEKKIIIGQNEEIEIKENCQTDFIKDVVDNGNDNLEIKFDSGKTIPLTIKIGEIKG